MFGSFFLSHFIHSFVCFGECVLFFTTHFCLSRHHHSQLPLILSFRRRPSIFSLMCSVCVCVCVCEGERNVLNIEIILLLCKHRVFAAKSASCWLEPMSQPKRVASLLTFSLIYRFCFGYNIFELHTAVATTTYYHLFFSTLYPFSIENFIRNETNVYLEIVRVFLCLSLAFFCTRAHI